MKDLAAVSVARRRARVPMGMMRDPIAATREHRTLLGNCTENPGTRRADMIARRAHAARREREARARRYADDDASCTQTHVLAAAPAWTGRAVAARDRRDINTKVGQAVAGLQVRSQAIRVASESFAQWTIDDKARWAADPASTSKQVDVGLLRSSTEDNLRRGKAALQDGSYHEQQRQGPRRLNAGVAARKTRHSAEAADEGDSQNDVYTRSLVRKAQT